MIWLDLFNEKHFLVGAPMPLAHVAQDDPTGRMSDQCCLMDSAAVICGSRAALLVRPRGYHVGFVPN
jgi:hypothetical protein